MSGRIHRDRGSASIYAAAVGLVLVLTGLAVAVQGSRLVTREQARTAADLGALAGAQRAVLGEGDACGRARQVARANGGDVLECRLDGLDLVLAVRVAGQAGPAEAAARAGPVRIADGGAGSEDG